MAEARGIIEGYVPGRIPGIECDLYLSDSGAKVATVVSDNAGHYKFTHLESGTYDLKFFGGGLGEGDWLYNIPVIGNVESDIDKIPPIDFKDTSSAIGLEPGTIDVSTAAYNVVGVGTYFERYAVGKSIQIIGSRYNDGTYTITEILGNDKMKVSHTFSSPEKNLGFVYIDS